MKNQLTPLDLIGPRQWRTQEKISGGSKVGGPASYWAPGGGAPGRQRIVENLEKNSGRKLQKCCIFAYFAKKFQNHALNFRAFGRKTIVLGNFEKF